MTRTHTLAVGATAAVLALTLAACSDNSDSSPTDTSSYSGTSDSSTSQSPAPVKDRSSQVFNDAREPQVLGSAAGTVDIGIGSAVAEGLTFEVTRLEATTDGTILRYQLTTREGTENLGVEGWQWYEQPTLQVPGSDTRLPPVTASVPGGDFQGAQERCVCTSVRSVGPDPRSQTTMYPSLPKDATKVEVTLPGLDPVTVPISR